MEPAISVLMPVRNAAGTVRAALGSVLRQTRGDFEVIVLDDGSSDGTASVALAFGDPRVRVLSDGDGRGIAYRLNQGIDLARGRYLARMDGDDVCFPERFERQAGFLDAHAGIDLVGTRAVVFRPDGAIVGLLPYAPTHEALIGRPWRMIPLPHPTWMGRREWFARHRYRLPEVRRAEDQELLMRAAPTSRYACLDEVLLGYRQGPYDLRRTLVARRSLVAAQVGHHLRHRDPARAALVLGVTLAKVAVDLLAALPGLDRAYWGRMAEPVPEASRAQLALLLG